MLGSSDPLASLFVVTREKALRFIEQWLEPRAPGEAVHLLFVGKMPGLPHAKIQLPAYWYYDFMSHLHRPVPNAPDLKHTFRSFTFDYEQLHVDYHTVVGPIPDLPR